MPRVYCQAHRFTSCCFCLNLKSGCRVIGILTTFVCSLELVSACHKLIALLETEKLCVESDKWQDDDNNYIKICPHIKFVQFMLIIDFIIFVLGFNGSILLLYGIKSKQPRLFMAWLVFASVVIFTNLISILIFHNKHVMSNLIMVLTLSYFFKVVRSYHQQLLDEINNGCPVVAVAFPQESGMRVFVPTQRTQPTSDVKDDPPPPYPGLPVVSSSVSLESQPPPPYASISHGYNEQMSGADNISSASHDNLVEGANGEGNEESNANDRFAADQNEPKGFAVDDGCDGAVANTPHPASPPFSGSHSYSPMSEVRAQMLNQDETLPESLKNNSQQASNSAVPPPLNGNNSAETFLNEKHDS